jgi:hypothetical protein
MTLIGKCPLADLICEFSITQLVTSSSVTAIEAGVIGSFNGVEIQISQSAPAFPPRR